MKITHKMPKTDEKLHNDLINSGWTQLKEPKSLLLTTIVSIPLMLVNVFVAACAIHIFSDLTLREFGFASGSFTITIHFGVILGILLTVVIHEFIHLLFVPNFIQSPQTFIGFTFFGGYVYTTEEISKARYMIITAAPFISLSILLPIILGLMGVLTPLLKILILLNAASSSVDMLLLLLLIQTPKNTVLKSNGIRTYWRRCRCSSY
ncbi:DUF3267 domain-containing protein [Virgibacillus ainsalahensis]